MALNPIRPTDTDAIQLAKRLITSARFGALAIIHPKTKTPHATRIAIGTTQNGTLLSLISDLSLHTKALRQSAACGLLLGEPSGKGDPLTHPRISLQATASFLARDDPQFAATREAYLESHPKSKLYIDFADFNFVTFHITQASLNGGFGKAYELTKLDLAD
jgi:putative heme iron utilization protein